MYKFKHIVSGLHFLQPTTKSNFNCGILFIKKNFNCGILYIRIIKCGSRVVAVGRINCIAYNVRKMTVRIISI